LSPYKLPATDTESDGTCAVSNPAKTLLYVIGTFGILQGAIGVPVGLFVGPHVLFAAIATLSFGSTALWLGHRQYDRFGRCGTMTWGGLALLLILVATWVQPPSTQDVAGIVFIALLLVVIGTVLVMAVWKRSGECAS